MFSDSVKNRPGKCTGVADGQPQELSDTVDLGMLFSHNAVQRNALAVERLCQGRKKISTDEQTTVTVMCIIVPAIEQHKFFYLQHFLT